MHEFLNQYPVLKMDKGVTVLSYGQPTSSFFYLEKGSVKMVSSSKEGQNLILHIFNKGSFFPLFDLVEEDRSSELVCLTEIEYRRVPKTEFMAYLKTHPEDLFDLQLRLLRGMKGLTERLQQKAWVSAYAQVAGLLLYFARHFSEVPHDGLPTQMTIRITHQEISEWLGLTRESVSVQMKELERKGLIRKAGQLIELVDVKELEKLTK